MEILHHTTTAKIKRKESFKVTSSSTNVIHVGQPVFWLLEIEDAIFHTNSAVFMPEPIQNLNGAQSPIHSGLDSLVALFKFYSSPEHRTKRMLITGHTDTTGKKSYNSVLSKFRAAAILAIIDENRKVWCEQFKNRQKDGVETYIDEDVQQLLLWAAGLRKWDCHPGDIDGVIGPKTENAILRFQREYNSAYSKSIGEDGIVGEQTWGAFFDIIQEELSQKVNVWLSQQTTTAETDLKKLRTGIQWYDPARMGPGSLCGCGETWPIEEELKDNYLSEINRRVEVLFFEEEDKAELPCLTGKCIENKCPIFGKDTDGKSFYRRIYALGEDGDSSDFFFSI